MSGSIRPALRAAALIATLVCAAVPSMPAAAADEKADRVTIADPYIELRTGPGRGYPVFFVAARGEEVDIELRHTDWFRVRTVGDKAGGKVGWVSRAQLETTLAGGERKSFRDTIVDDFLARKVQLGGGYGRFKSEPMLKLWGSYRLSETLAIEATGGQVQGVFSGTDFWHLALMAEPWSDRRFSPFAGIGVGRFRNFPNSSLVDAQTTGANLAFGTVGLRYYLTDRFVLRADYSLYTVFLNDSRTNEYRAFTGGLSFFF